MAIRSMPLRKLLLLMHADPRLRTKKIREDILNDIRRLDGTKAGGPDFYSPFWRSAKDHVFGWADLHGAVEVHIRANSGRANLYPQLRDGFLLWWNERRRWTNQPFTEARVIKGTYTNALTGVAARIDNILSVHDGAGDDHFIYPYFSPDPALGSPAARIALWILHQAFPRVPLDELRVLDVIRGTNFSLQTVPFEGDEKQVFEARMVYLIGEWERLRAEYPPP